MIVGRDLVADDSQQVTPAADRRLSCVDIRGSSSAHSVLPFHREIVGVSGLRSGHLEVGELLLACHSSAAGRSRSTGRHTGQRALAMQSPGVSPSASRPGGGRIRRASERSGELLRTHPPGTSCTSSRPSSTRQRRRERGNPTARCRPPDPEPRALHTQRGERSEGLARQWLSPARGS